MDVQMPDGTIITGVPDNITQSELLGRYQNYQPSDPAAQPREGIRSVLPETSNPAYGLISRGAGIVGSGLEAVQRAGDYLATGVASALPFTSFTREQAEQVSRPQFVGRAAEATKAYSEGINYTPSTTLGELGDNPLKVIPFIAERIITSTPDMAAAVYAMPAYVTARTNEILNDRLKNDKKELKDATVADVGLSLAGAVAEATFEKLATQRLLKGAPVTGKSATTRTLKEVGIQSGTEGVEEGLANIAGSIGTVRGIDPKELGENILEGMIVGGGMGAGVRGTQEYLQSRKKPEADFTEPKTVIDPDTGIKRVYSYTPIDDPTLELGGTPEINGRKTYIYREKPLETEQESAPAAPPVAPPSSQPQGAPSNVGVDQAAMEEEWRLSQGELPLAPSGQVAQPAQIAQTGNVQVTPPVEPEPTPPAAPAAQVAQIPQAENVQPSAEDIVPLDDKGEPVETPKAVETAEPVAESSVAANTILQNRERSSPTSIAQMNAIANKPDYSRVAFSNSFLEGAPVVFGAQTLPAEQVGRQGSVVSAKTNRKIPVQYAVVDADQLIASNAVDGSSVPEYANPQFAGLKAVTNGRVAGLKEGYVRGTMGQYKQDLIADDIHGISPDVINRLKNPILVRVMPQNQVTQDIADESNTSSTLALSATERAKNDANRIDLDGLEFREDGAISPETVRGFVAAMPQSEQQELIDKQGRPTRQAYDRLNAAIFYKAYGNDALVSLAAEAKSVDAANIINGLSQAAPQMAKLAEAGDYDIRPQVVQAAETAINASRQGKKLSDVVSQQDLVSDNPVSRQVLQLFAKNTRSAKRIGEGLRGVAADVQTEASRPQEPDMFGEIQERLPVEQVVESSFAKPSEEVETISEARGAGSQNRTEFLANTFGRENVVYQDGDLALVLGNNMFNDPVYLPVKGTTYLKIDLTKDKKPNLLTTPEFDRLIAEKERIESEAQAKHKANPFIKFKDGIAVSDSISSLSPELADVFAGWKKMLRLNGNIYLTTIEDALANANRFTGPHRRIGVSAKKFAKEKLSGVTQKMGDDRYIIIDSDVSPEQMLEILAHEMGHAHQQEAFYGAPKDVRDKVQRAYEEWLKKQKGATAQELINALRPFRMARATKLDTPSFQAKAVLSNYDSYWTSFSEWYADNTARWATTSAKPLSVVDRFFAKVAQTLRSFYDAIKAGGFLPNETFKEYMDAITDKEAVAANPLAPDDVKGQLPLFAKQSAQPNLPGIAGKPKSLPLKAKPAATWQSLEPMTWKDTRAIQLFDKHRNLDLVQKEITEIAGEISGELNAYRAETLAHGRAERQVKDFLTGEFRPIIKEMKEGGITDEALTEYLVMRHAEEANDLIAERNPNDPTKQDKGSGVSYKQREDYFDALDPAKKKVFESLAKKVDGILKKTRDLLEEGGVITKEQREAWESMFDFYVPLRREESDYSLPTSSYRRVGDYAKSRTGSAKDVIDVLSNIAAAREIAINRIEKEKVNRAVYGLAVMNPNPEFWMAISPDAIKNKDLLVQELVDKFDLEVADAEAFVENIMAEPTKERFNKETGVVDRYIDTTAKYADYVLPVKINGKDRFVFFNPKNDRSMQMVQSLRGLDVPRLNAAMQMIAPVTRFFSAINTQYNLIFGAWNFARDVQGARLNLSTTPIADEKNAVLSGTFSAIPDIYKAVREQTKDQPFSDTSDGSWDDFTRHGGKVGYKDQFAKLNESTNIVNRELATLDRGITMRGAYKVLNYISNINDVLENATRLSAYRVALDKFKKEAEAKKPGETITQKQLEDMKARAADIAKNITVNFNRKGTWGVTAGSLYAFFNASAQGTKRLYETLTGPKGKTIMAAGIGIGIAQAIALAMAGFDEDEPTEFMKQKNLIIPTGDGKYVMWPMPFGFNVFPNLGRIFFETASKASKGQSVTPQLINTVTMLANAFNPLGGGGLLQMATPTVADPIVALIENRDAFGRPISRESRATSPDPGYKLSRDPSPSISQFLAEFINTITFGNKDKRGFLSPTADQMDYLGKQLGGGVYRELSGILTWVSNEAQDKETPDYKVPIIGKIVGDLNSPQAISQRFYSNVIKMAEHEKAIKGRIDRKESVTAYMRENPESSMWRRANKLENEISKLNRRRREMVEKDEPVERIKKLDDQKTRMMKQFNDQVRKYN